ncbi:MAG: outer membrane protein Omp28 [Bacteroidota bacterium]|jgi:hypothetical protein
MKKLLYLAFILTLVTGCKKDVELKDPYVGDIPPLPENFGQNILIEQFTSSTAGQAPAADLLLDSLSAQYGERFIGVNLHAADLLQADDVTDTATGSNTVDAFFNVTGIYPSGMVNRMISSSADLSPVNYSGKTAVMLGNTPRCGIAIDANEVRNGYLNLSVHVGFSNDLAGAYRLHIYLVENEFVSTDSLYDQANEFSQNGTNPLPGSPFYSLPPMINGYAYPKVLRRIINNGGVDGEVIPANVALKGKEYVKDYIVDVRNLDTDNYSVVVFVDKYSTDAFTHRIENARSANIGTVAVWN